MTHGIQTYLYIKEAKTINSKTTKNLEQGILVTFKDHNDNSKPPQSIPGLPRLQAPSPGASSPALALTGPHCHCAPGGRTGLCPMCTGPRLQ